MSVIIYMDKEEYEEMAYMAPRGGILKAVTPYSSEEVGPDWEAEGKVKIEIQRV
jgi:hypothetical protein